MNRTLLVLTSLLPLVASCDPAEPTPDEPPDFNFIPLNEAVCEPSTTAELDSAHGAIHELVYGDTDGDGTTDYQHWVAHDFSLCDGQSVGACGPCPTNPLGEFLDDLDAVSGLIAGEAVAHNHPSLRAYFNTALQYPVRDLNLHVQDQGEQATLLLSQAIPTGCGADCTFGQVAPETLAENCTDVKQTLLAAASDASPGRRFDGLAGTEPFGFLVPLSHELLPFEDYDTAVDAVNAALTLPHWAVRAADPTITTVIDGDAGCMYMTAWVSGASAEEALGTDGAQFLVDGGYMDEAKPGHVKMVLSATLAPATLENGTPLTLEEYEALPSPAVVDVPDITTLEQ